MTTRSNILRAYSPDDDNITIWLSKYMDMIQEESADPKKIERCLKRFVNFFIERYGHQKVSAIVKRDVEAWLKVLYDPKEAGGFGFVASYVNSHHSALKGFTKWLRAAAPHLMAKDPMHRVKQIMLPDPEPKTLTHEQVLSLKNICDRLERFHMKTDRKKKSSDIRGYSRPLRDRAIVYVLLSTGLRREELVMVDLDQVVPRDPRLLRSATSAKIVRVRGKGKTEGTVYLSADARNAVADYLEYEWIKDVSNEAASPLFLSGARRQNRNSDGRMHKRTINKILEQIAEWHDGEQKDESRHISPLHPHRLRHSFANELARNPNVTEQDLQRLIRHRNARYLSVYTKPPEERSASFIENH